MPTFTLAGDESGDVSMSFAKGASRNFVIAMIATPYPDQLRSEFEVFAVWEDKVIMMKKI
jgi:hypothetical protein